MLRLPARALLLLAAAAMLALSGCDEGSSTLSKAEWVEQVNAMCKEQLEDWDEWERRFDNASGPVGLANVFDELLPELRTDVEEFESFGPPEGDEARYRQVLEYDQRLLELVEELAEALRENQGPRLQTLIDEMDELTTKNDALARELGADECARSPTSEDLR